MSFLVVLISISLNSTIYLQYEDAFLKIILHNDNITAWYSVYKVKHILSKYL